MTFHTRTNTIDQALALSDFRSRIVDSVAATRLDAAPLPPTFMNSDDVLLSGTAKVRASTVLQKNVKLYGPKNALDGNPSTCWNSDGAVDGQQWYQIDFGRLVRLTRVSVQFQAGFSAEVCSVQWKTDETGSFNDGECLEFEDDHDLQEHTLTDAPPCSALRLCLSDFSDFYGRVICYRVEAHGKLVDR